MSPDLSRARISELAEILIQQGKINSSDKVAAIERCIRVRLPKRVLVVDDSATMRSIVRKLLSASRFRLEIAEAPEGIEALKEVVGPVDRVLAQLIGGIQSGMGYLGAANLEELRAKARFIRVSAAGIKEAAPHDVVELKTGN